MVALPKRPNQKTVPLLMVFFFLSKQTLSARTTYALDCVPIS